MPIARSALAAVWLALALTGAVAAQDASKASGPAPDTTADVLILDHDFQVGSNEFVRVFLEARQVYRGELSSADVSVQIRSVGGRIKPPRVYSRIDRETASGASIFEVHPDVDAEYEIRPLAGSGAGSRLRLYRDVRESHRRMALLARPGWEIGVEVSAGWHAGFAQSTAQFPAPAVAPEPHAGSDVEACFSARNAPGLSRLGMCVLGLGYQSQARAPSILWIYTEPRFRLLGRAVRGRSNWELGALFRVGFGSLDRRADTPTILAPGAYVARHIRTNERGAGWSIQGSYHRAAYHGFSRPFGSTDPPVPHSDLLTLGVGWYQ